MNKGDSDTKRVETDSRGDSIQPESTDRDAGAEPANFIAGLLPSANADEATQPRIVETGGDIGIGLGVFALALAVFGAVAGWFDYLAVSRTAFAFSLLLVFASMCLGVIYQLFVLRS